MARNHFWKQFSNKVLYNYSSKFLLLSVSVGIKKFENGFPTVFSKSELAMEELHFHWIFVSKKAKPLRIYPSIRFGGFRNLIFSFVHYHPQVDDGLALSTQHSILCIEHSTLCTRHSALLTWHLALSTFYSGLFTQPLSVLVIQYSCQFLLLFLDYKQWPNSVCSTAVIVTISSSSL